jgi:hypothetical protein
MAFDKDIALSRLAEMGLGKDGILKSVYDAMSGAHGDKFLSQLETFGTDGYTEDPEMKEAFLTFLNEKALEDDDLLNELYGVMEAEGYITDEDFNEDETAPDEEIDIDGDGDTDVEIKKEEPEEDDGVPRGIGEREMKLPPDFQKKRKSVIAEILGGGRLD